MGNLVPVFRELSVNEYCILNSFDVIQRAISVRHVAWSRFPRQSLKAPPRQPKALPCLLGHQGLSASGPAPLQFAWENFRLLWQELNSSLNAHWAVAGKFFSCRCTWIPDNMELRNQLLSSERGLDVERWTVPGSRLSGLVSHGC